MKSSLYILENKWVFTSCLENWQTWSKLNGKQVFETVDMLNCEVLTSCPPLKQGCVSADHNSCDSTWREMVLSQCFNYAFEHWILGMLFYWMCVYCSRNKNLAFACAACALWCFETTADLGLIVKCLSCCVSGMCCFSTASFLL